MALSRDRLTLPVVINQTYVEDASVILNEAATYYGVEPSQLVAYGIAAVIGLYTKPRAEDENFALFMGKGFHDPEMVKLIDPRAAGENGKI